MKKEKIAVGPRMKWGTWEELILCSAVLRHGSRDWYLIASELRLRTAYPFSFTPEACKAKYEELRRRYSGGKAMFEELRKCRVEELKKELEKSEETIGSLEAKLKRLKAEHEEACQVDYDTSRTESPEPVPKNEAVEFSVKEASKDSLSAGSFTQGFRSSCSPECQITELASTPEMETKLKVLESNEHETLVRIKVAEGMNEKGSTVRKRRGKRKRKDCKLEVREGSVEENDHFGLANIQTSPSWKEALTSGCGKRKKKDYNVEVREKIIGESNHYDSDNVQTNSSWKETSVSGCGVKSTHADGHSKELFRGTSGGLMETFSSIAESKHAVGFKRRLDSQKRARYKKIIRQHMDLDTIRSRINSGTIRSTRELFRDLLLLATNALVFYSKRTREYKSAFSLREFLMNEYRQHCKDSVGTVSPSIVHLSPICNTPVRPRSFRPRPEKSKFSAKPTDTASGIAGTLLGNKRVGDMGSSTPSYSLQPSMIARKSSGAPQGYLKLRNTDSISPPLGSLVTSKKHVGMSPGWKKHTSTDSPSPKQSRYTNADSMSLKQLKLTNADSNSPKQSKLTDADSYSPKQSKLGNHDFNSLKQSKSTNADSNSPKQSKPINADSNSPKQSMPTTKKGHNHPGKMGRGTPTNRPKTVTLKQMKEKEQDNR